MKCLIFVFSERDLLASVSENGDKFYIVTRVPYHSRHDYLFTNCRESVEKLSGMDDEFVEVDKSVSVLQCRNLHV